VTTPDDTAVFGEQVLGPVVAEFCLRLWQLGAMLDSPEDAVLLFCARGGLRMRLAYEQFLQASGLQTPIASKPLMVSRVVAMRSALAHALDSPAGSLGPGTVRTLGHEFGRSSVADLARAVSGQAPGGAAGAWDVPVSRESVEALFRSPDGSAVNAMVRDQTQLFETHLDDLRDGRRHVVLVDTGLHGTTTLLLQEALPDLTFGSALMASYYPPTRNERPARTFGLSLEADGYAPWHRRSVLLRYWHLIEWLFEPALPSVPRVSTGTDGVVRSNLESDGWEEQVLPEPGTLFGGVMTYLSGLGPGVAREVVPAAATAWKRLHRTLVLPGRTEAENLVIHDRSHDFGRTDTFGARPWRGATAALRGAAMWREGEIARAGTPLRVPLLLGIEAAYGARRVSRKLSAKTYGGGRSGHRR
jgi:hypothetical protein